MSDPIFTRLFQQQIQQPHFSTASDVVQWLGALQGQDYAAVKWAIGCRIPASTDQDIEAAFRQGHIIRTWAMRGTLFVIHPADYRWIVGLFGQRQIAGRKGRRTNLGLDDDTLHRAESIILNALAGGKRASRKELCAVLEAHAISTSGQRGIHILSHLSLLGMLYQADAPKNDTVFLRTDETLPPTPDLSREEAIAELARRYFTSHGPATIHDFGWWSSLPMGEARKGLASIEHDLVKVEIDGVPYYCADVSPAPPPSPRADVLPAFDEYLLGYKDRELVLDPVHAEKVCPGNNGVFQPLLLIDGQIVGIWKRVTKANNVTVTLQPFEALPADHLIALQNSTRRYADFVGLPLKLG